MSLIRSKSFFRGLRFAGPYLSLFLYVVMLSTSIIIATIIVHEAGHYALGSLFGCREMKIVLFDADKGSTYTQMNCSDASYLNILALGGFLFVIPFGLIFFLIRNFPERHFWLIILGFNLIISYADLGLITNVAFLPASFAFVGLGMLITGETLLIDNYIYNVIDEVKERSYIEVVY